ncbi:MAG: response regulator transcription factor [Chloroflexi bacterium]|nr:response regulator transcription factor [Chloroflexota bacterium]
MIKVSVVADNMAMRVGLREVFNNLPDLSVVSADSRSDDLSAPMDVLVMVTPANIRNIENKQAILYLTDDPADIQELISLDFSVWGALPVNASENELNCAIHALADGLWIGDPGLVRKLFQQKLEQEFDDIDLLSQALTPRETEVLQLAAQGLANKQIAVRLGISEHTIKFHLSSLYTKLGVSSRTEAVRAGVRRGLVVL